MRLPALALLTVTGLAVGCSSSAGDTGTTSPAPPITSALTTSAPTTAPSDTATPVASPAALPKVIRRKVSKPAGARNPGFDACGAGVSSLDVDIEQGIFDAPSRQQQLIDMAQIASSARVSAQETVKGRARWLAAGWPRTNALVRDLDRFISIYHQVATAAAGNDLDAIPGLYVAYKSADGQMSADIDSAGVCK